TAGTTPPPPPGPGPHHPGTPGAGCASPGGAHWRKKDGSRPAGTVPAAGAPGPSTPPAAPGLQHAPGARTGRPTLSVTVPLCLARPGIVAAFGPVAAEDEGGVLPAETEGIAQDPVHGHGTRLPGHVVQIAGGILLIQVDGGRDHIVPNGEDAGDGLHGAGGPQQVADHGLGGADGQLIGMLAENRLDGLGLADVPRRGAGAVGVDVVD